MDPLFPMDRSLSSCRNPKQMGRVLRGGGRRFAVPAEHELRIEFMPRSGSGSGSGVGAGAVGRTIGSKTTTTNPTATAGSSSSTTSISNNMLITFLCIQHGSAEMWGRELALHQVYTLGDGSGSGSYNNSWSVPIFTWHGCIVDILCRPVFAGPWTPPPYESDMEDTNNENHNNSNSEDNNHDHSVDHPIDNDSTLRYLHIYLEDDVPHNMAAVNTHAQLEGLRDQAVVAATTQAGAVTHDNDDVIEIDVIEVDDDNDHEGDGSYDGQTQDDHDSGIFGPRVLIVGATPESGTTSLFKTLAQYAVKVGRTPILIDLDPNDNWVSGVPGTLSAAYVTSYRENNGLLNTPPTTISTTTSEEDAAATTTTASSSISLASLLYGGLLSSTTTGNAPPSSTPTLSLWHGTCTIDATNTITSNASNDTSTSIPPPHSNYGQSQQQPDDLFQMQIASLAHKVFQRLNQNQPNQRPHPRRRRKSAAATVNSSSSSVKATTRNERTSGLIVHVPPALHYNQSSTSHWLDMVIQQFRISVVLVAGGHDQLYHTLHSQYILNHNNHCQPNNDNNNSSATSTSISTSSTTVQYVIKLPRSGGIVHRDAKMRSLDHVTCWRRYFYGDAAGGRWIRHNVLNVVVHEWTLASRYTPSVIAVQLSTLQLYQITSMNLSSSLLPLGATQSTDKIQLQLRNDLLRFTPTTTRNTTSTDSSSSTTANHDSYYSLRHQILAVCHPGPAALFHKTGRASDMLGAGVAGFVVLERVQIDSDTAYLFAPCNDKCSGNETTATTAVSASAGFTAVLPSSTLLLGDPQTLTWLE